MPINWRKPIQWSDGEQSGFAPYDRPADSVRWVLGPKEWRDMTGDDYVSVNAETGEILGCEGEFPHIQNLPEPKRPPVYVHLFHGRNTPDEQLDDWGFDGPVIGPLNYIHITYMCDIKFGASLEVMEKFFPEEVERLRERGATNLEDYPIDHHFSFEDDLIVHDGKFYGDMSIAAFPQGARDHNATE